MELKRLGKEWLSTWVLKADDIDEGTYMKLMISFIDYTASTDTCITYIYLPPAFKPFMLQISFQHLVGFQQLFPFTNSVTNKLVGFTDSSLEL